jgi:hypothetical protein
MMMRSEVILMVVAVGIYLFDSVLLLHRNEAVMYRTTSGKWNVGFGVNGWKVRGKEPYLPNPFTPFQAPFKLQWSMEGLQKSAKPVVPLHFPDDLADIGVFVSGAAFGLLVVLPLGLFTSLWEYLSVAALAYVYCNLIAALVLMYGRRGGIGLSQKQCASIAFECLVCVPLGINLSRKLARLQVVREDLTVASKRLLDQPQLEACDRACSLRLLEEMDAEAEGSERMSALKINLERMRKGPSL